MSYVGGKIRSAQFIVDVLNRHEFNHLSYLEPFCGYCSICSRVVNKSSYSLSDKDALLVRLLTGIQRFEPIPSVSRDEYSRLKTAPEVTLKRATAAFCYSFSGKKWGGFVDKYTRNDGKIDDIPQSRKNYYARLQTAKSFQSATLVCRDYRDLTPNGSIIYADPPYSGVLGYGDKFDSEEFWETMREWSKCNVVFISEYHSPPDFVCVGQNAKSVCLAGGNKQTQRIERLFLHESSKYISLFTSSGS